MTKRWSSTHSLDGQTKRQASKAMRRDGLKEPVKKFTDTFSGEDVILEDWREKQRAAVRRSAQIKERGP